MMHVYSDGGRAAHGFKGEAGDCVPRSIAIAAGLDYGEVYDELHKRAKDAASRARTRRHGSPRSGVHRNVWEPYVLSLGFERHATMSIGSGCQVHLTASELPAGRLIVQVSKHLTAVLNGICFDTHDPSREGTRCVYGYYARPS